METSKPMRKEPEDGTIWYFAFGSNMNDVTLARRKVRYCLFINSSFTLQLYSYFDSPIERVRCKLYDWKLAYNLRGFPFLEPSFANIEPSVGDIVHGVCHRITIQEWEGIKATEGGGGIIEEGYHTKELEVESYEGDIIKAVTLSVKSPKVKHLKKKHYPSRRYLDLIVNGAIAHELDEDYIKWLKAHRAYNVEEHVQSKWVKMVCYASVFSVAPLVIPLFVINAFSYRIGLPKPIRYVIGVPILKTNFFISSLLWVCKRSLLNLSID